MLEILGKIGFDWQVALANLINFLIIFWLLKKFFFKSIKQAITDRQNKIKKGLEDAKRAETELIMARSKYDEVVSDAKIESKNILSEVGEKRDALLLNAKTEAEDLAQKIREEALVEIATLKKKQEDELKNKSIDLVVASVEAVLKENINKASAEKIINRMTNV